MQLVIQMTKGDNCPEWTMLEFQGSIESKNGDQLLNSLIGDLLYTKKGQPIFIIGHHVLFGKISELESPMVVVVKTRSSHSDVDHPIPNIENTTSPTYDVEYEVSAVIKKKICFQSRPKPIVTNVKKKV